MCLRNIDAELLIEAVEQKEEIWNPLHELYKNKEKRRQAWLEISRKVYPDFETYDADEQIYISCVVMRRWTHLRRAYARSMKFEQAALAQGVKAPRKYVYKENLAFLEKLNNAKFNISEGDLTHMQLVDEDNSNDLYEEQIPLPAKRKHDVMQHSFENIVCEIPEKSVRIQNDSIHKDPLASANENKDEDMEFFSSLLSSIKKFNDDQKLEFRMEVISIIQAIRKKARNLEDQPP